MVPGLCDAPGRDRGRDLTAPGICPQPIPDGNIGPGDDICQVTPTLTAADFASGKLTYANEGSCVSLAVDLVCAM